MTELHCHILPGIDDGAKNLDESIALLRLEQEQGVTEVVFTPHFDPDTISLAEFCEKREAAFKLLQENLPEELKGLSMSLGAEVCFSAALLYMDLKPLCLGGTDAILLELPYSILPGNTDDILFAIAGQGYIPVLAHVERYSYLRSDPVNLYRWIQGGALAQINAGTILREGKTRDWVMKLFKWGMVHILCSDAHSTEFRPPLQKRAFEALTAQLGEQAPRQLQENAHRIFAGEYPEVDEPVKPRRFLGLWR